MGLAGGPTNIFNALSGLSQGTELRLQILAMSGGSAVSNAFTEEADRLGLTAKGRERKEREEQRRVTERMEAIREQAAKFQERLNLLEQASAEALMQNEEQLRLARENLRLVRERAYEITLPDGTAGKVYRDGDKVRKEDGTITTAIKPEELPNFSPTWTQLDTAHEAVRDLERERREIEKYQEKLDLSKSALSSGDLTPEKFQQLQDDVGEMPPSVARHFRESSEPTKPQPAKSNSLREQTMPSTVRPLHDFASAVSGPRASVAEDDADFSRIPPSVSAPAPK